MPADQTTRDDLRQQAHDALAQAARDGYGPTWPAQGLIEVLDALAAAERDLRDIYRLCHGRPGEDYVQAVERVVVERDRAVALHTEEESLRWREVARAEAAEREREEAMTRALALAHGCHDYGGGYHEESTQHAYHHGIDTVVNVLTAARRGVSDDQMQVIEAIGRDTLRAADERARPPSSGKEDR